MHRHSIYSFAGYKAIFLETVWLERLCVEWWAKADANPLLLCEGAAADREQSTE
jgi:hypothetical protein